MMHGGKTGYPAGLLQDDHTKLSKWFASKPDARMIVRQVCKEILEKKHEHKDSICNALRNCDP